MRAKELGIGLRSGGTRTGPLSSADLEKIGLAELAARLSGLAGRPVNFMVFDSIARALSRGPSIVVP